VKNSNNITGNRTRELSLLIAVPQPNAALRPNEETQHCELRSSGLLRKDYW
jgi:hypothetical protein